MTKVDSLNAEFAKNYPEKFSRILGRGNPDEIARILDKLPVAAAASIVSKLPATSIHALLVSGKHKLHRWLSEAPLRDAVALLSRLPREQCLTLVNSLKHRERRKRLLQYLKYPAHSVGAQVTDLPVRVTSDTPAAEFIEELRSLKITRPRPIVVVHPDGRYCGMLNLWLLLTRTPPAGQIEDYVLPAPAIYPETSLASSVKDPGWHEHSWLPVVDHQQRILGGISRRSVFESAARMEKHGGSAGDLLSFLINDLAFMFGELLTRSMARK